MSDRSPPKPAARFTFSEVPALAKRPRPDEAEAQTRTHLDPDTEPSVSGADVELDAPTRKERPGPAPAVRVESAAATRLQARYSEAKAVGRGGMSTVHAVRDAVVGRRVAVKVFKSGGPISDEDEERFIEEARITGQLEHPNIVPIHDLTMETGGEAPYFTMKLVQGRTLTELIRAHASEPLTAQRLEELLEVYLRVCDAVAYAHTRGVIHRDLKPENIMVGAHGQVYLMDWGVARLMPRPADDPDAVAAGKAAVRDERGSIIGTMIYMAPEQALGLTDETDERTDVFGLGGILYAILTARPLYLGRTHMEVLRQAREGLVFPPEIAAPHRSPPPELCRIALKAVSVRPADRYQTVSALRAEVAAFVRGGGWFPTRSYAAGTTIVEEGTVGDSAFIIVSGECEVSKADRGVARTIKRLGPGEVFGEAGVFTARPRTASVVALTEVTVKLVTREALQRELEGRDWLRAFFEALADRFVSLDAEFTRLRDGSRGE